MGLAFNRFLEVVSDRCSTRSVTILLYSLLGLFVLFCLVLALT